MEKKFIFKQDLGEIMEGIAEEALKHVDKMRTRVTFCEGGVNVVVYMKDIPYNTLSEIHYDIINSFEDSIDAMDHIFRDALVALENLTVIKKEETNNF